MPWYCRALIASVPLTAIVFVRFGLDLGLGEYTLNFCLIAEYCVLVVFALAGWLALHQARTFLFLCTAFSATMSYRFNGGSSASSLALLLVLYFPFCFRMTSRLGTRKEWASVARIFLNLCYLCALAGIGQFLAQAAIHSLWLIDFRSLIPAAIRAKGTYNTAIHAIGGFYKSNGFFLREPSEFSQLMALGLLLESTTSRRAHRLVVLVTGLLVSYSGTGLMALAVGAMFPLRFKTVLRVMALILLGGAVFFVFGNLLHLSATVGRIGEFSSTGSSAYQRFFAPLTLLEDVFRTHPFSYAFGLGPGSIVRLVRDYGFFDPTWAKLIIEYGAFGTLAILALVWKSINSGLAPIQFRAALLVTWIALGENLLGAPLLSLVFVLLALWPEASKPATYIRRTPLGTNRFWSPRFVQPSPPS